jgi:hypothetical protein
MGLGVSYSGSHHEDVLILLLPAVVNGVVLMMIARSGVRVHGQRKREITSATLMERDDKALDEK